MTSHGRKNGQRDSHPIPVWNGILEEKHREKIDSAIWTFLWLLDAVTEDRDGVGIVKGGAPVKIGEIGGKGHERSARRDLKRLAKHGYIRLRRNPYGFRVEVMKSLKFGIWHAHKRSANLATLPQESGQSGRTDRPSWPVQSGQSGPGKEDAAVVRSKDAAVEPLPLHPSWKALGVDTPIGNALFRGEWEAHFDANPPNGRSLAQVAEDFIVAYNAQHGRWPPRGFFDAKHRLDALEAVARPCREEIHRIEVPE